MADIDEQRKKVEELKRKILEQKKSGGIVPSSDLAAGIPPVEVKEAPVPVQAPVLEAKQQPVVEHQRPAEGGIHKPEKSIPPQKEELKIHGDVEKTAPRVVSVIALQAYAQALKQAWSNGSVSDDEKNLLEALRKSLGISEEEHLSLEQEVRLEIYIYAIAECWKHGALTAQDLDRLDALRERFNISAEEHLRLEKQVRQEILRQH